LIQATIAFHHLQAKVSFDYQPFLVAQISMLNFLMYNVRNTSGAQSQRLFSILEGVMEGNRGLNQRCVSCLIGNLRPFDGGMDFQLSKFEAQFAIIDLWVSTSKTSDNEQKMCISFGSVAIEGKGRMSGIVELGKLKIHTSIEWPETSSVHCRKSCW
jgi:hypothetical protein